MQSASGLLRSTSARRPGRSASDASREALAFQEASFDATLSQLVVNFVADAEAGVREMARVTRPGGIVASCVWDYAGEMNRYARSRIRA